LKELGYVHTVRSAKKLIERQSSEVWDILEEVTKGHPVLLNRAPTLHRLSIQAFEPLLIEGEAIRIHPLVCTAYNADFDGDQMAVHVPLSVEAQLEARLLMMAPNNIFSPSSGRPIMTPTQDITLGVYYLTAEPRAHTRKEARLPLCASKSEVIFAFEDGAFGIHDRVRLANPDFGRKTEYGDDARKVIETTVGRVFFSEIWPEELGFPNLVVGKSQLGNLIWKCYKICGHEKTVTTLDKLKEAGFREATRAGVSIGIDDMIIPKEKNQEIAETDRRRRAAVPQRGDHPRRTL
jgi:DNA-directed RNA polymerase subunit beta'